MNPRLWNTLVAVIVVLTAARVAATDQIFSQVIDEPVHIGAGYQWLTGSYTIDVQHPPLARVLAALPLYMSGVHPPADHDWIRYGNGLLGRGRDYIRHLRSARLGNLLLLAMAILSVAFWARSTIGDSGALVAAAMFATLPPILGHAGVATTDLALVATLPLASIALRRWLLSAKWSDAAIAGVATGLGVLSKFSFLVFFPVCALALIVAIRPRIRRGQMLAAIAMSMMIVWAGYQFELRTIQQANANGPRLLSFLTPEPLQGLVQAFAERVPIPAPSMIVGLADLKLHDLRGHTAFLLGETREHGWWYYFPLAIFFKSPIPFLILSVAGLVVLSRRAPVVGFCAIGMLMVAMTASINIGVRHVLPVYAPMSIAAGAAAIWSWQRGVVGRTAVAALLAWQLIGTAAAHPDYLAWFNGFAGPHPERILSDSNLDWGQDLLPLVRACRKQKIDRIGLVAVTSADLDAIGMPPRFAVDPLVSSSGWIAISETALQNAGGDEGESWAWVRHARPFQRIGKSIRLYPPTGQATDRATGRAIPPSGR